MMGAKVVKQAKDEDEEDEDDEDEDEDEDEDDEDEGEEGGSSSRSSSLLLIGKKKKRTTSTTTTTTTPNRKKRMNDSERVRSEEAASAAKILYPIRYISPGWTVAEEKERGKLGGSGLEPTFRSSMRWRPPISAGRCDYVSQHQRDRPRKGPVGSKHQAHQPPPRRYHHCASAQVQGLAPRQGHHLRVRGPAAGLRPHPRAHGDGRARVAARGIRREREDIGALGFVDARATFEDRHFHSS
jgi:hypothetical protein